MRISAAEFRQTARRNKYGAKKTTLDGITFDSKAEARYYAALKQREKQVRSIRSSCSARMSSLSMAF